MMKINVKNNSTNRNLASMIDLLNHDKQSVVVRNDALFIINKPEVKKDDITIKTINDINWVK